MSRNIFLLLLLAASWGCASLPSADDLTNALIESSKNDPESDITPEHARCVAEELLETNLSDTTLSGLAEDFTKPMVLNTEAKRLPKIISDISQKCSE